jgi:hypothetical protein
LTARPGGADNQAIILKEINTMGASVQIILFNLKAYKEKILPAYQAYSSSQDFEPIITLLKDVCQKLDTSPKLSKATGWNNQVCENQIRVLKEGVYLYSDNAKGVFKAIDVSRKEQISWIDSSIIQVIINVFCIPYDQEDVYPEQTLSDSAFAKYLYDQSELFGNIWSFLDRNRSESLTPALGEETEVITREGIQKIDADLAKIQPPKDPKLRKEYKNFLAMVKLALEDPSLTLVIMSA